MRDHALPQDVTGYRFHIVGSMTLKQFAELCVGCIAGLITYATNLPDVLKWPLILFFVGMGALVAFVPFEERPLDHWVTTFFRVLYRPTLFFWQKQAKVPDVFSFESRNPNATDLVQDVDLTPARRERVREYLRSIDQDEPTDSFGPYQQRYNEVMGLMNSHSPLSSSSPSFSPSSWSPSNSFDTSDMSIPGQTSVQINPTTTQAFSAGISPLPTSSVQIQLGSAPLVDQGVVVPDSGLISVETDLPPTASEGSLPSFVAEEQAYAMSEAGAAIDLQAVIPVQLAQPLPGLPLPTPPTQPNKLAGIVINNQNQPLDGAIIEIITATGMSARAVKANPLGQFYITTPLGNGSYILKVEKAGLQFQPRSIELTGKVVPPIEVRSV